jgi:hypothetical protein
VNRDLGRVGGPGHQAEVLAAVVLTLAGCPFAASMRIP